MTFKSLPPLSDVPVGDIIVERRLREVSEAGVASVMASITEAGVMKDPIHVRQKKNGKLYLMAGGHRLEAIRKLGGNSIKAYVWKGVSDDFATLIEIDDNLAGADLTALDRAVFLAERKALYEKVHPETKAGVAGGLARHGAATELGSFAVSAAETMGVTPRQVRKFIAAGTALTGDEIRWLRAAPRPVTLKDLQALAKIADDHERSQVCIAMSNGEVKSAAEARQRFAAKSGAASPSKDPVEEGFKALLTAWKRAPKAARRRFVEEENVALFGMLRDLDGGLAE